VRDVQHVAALLGPDDRLLDEFAIALDVLRREAIALEVEDVLDRSVAPRAEEERLAAVVRAVDGEDVIAALDRGDDAGAVDLSRYRVGKDAVKRIQRELRQGNDESASGGRARPAA